MTSSFPRFADRIAEAGDPDTRKSLLRELAQHRATHLDDPATTRDATWAISQLLDQLGRKDQAVKEARELLALSEGDERREAQRWVSSLTGEVLPRDPRGERPPRQPREDRPQREARPPREDRGPRQDRPMDRQLDPRGPRPDMGRPRGMDADLALLWVHVKRALASEDPAVRTDELQAMDQLLGARLVGGVGGDRQAENRRPARGDDPLVRLIGDIPSGREGRIHAIEAFADAHPDQIDELAFTAVRSHLGSSQPEGPAPWLAGILARALVASPGSRSRQALAELRRSPGPIATAFVDPMFDRLVRIAKTGARSGQTYAGLRRGVLPRAEAPDRKLWTLRLASDTGEVMVAAAAPDVSPGPELAEQLVRKLLELSQKVALLAPGDGNAALREAATAAGIPVFDGDAPDTAVLEAFGALPERPAREPRKPREPREPREPGTEADRPRREDGVAAVLARLSADGAPTEDELAALLRDGPRAWKIVQGADRALAGLADADARAATLLSAVDATARDDQPMPEGTTLGVKIAASGGATTRAMLSRPRFGGPGIDALVDVAAAAVGGGWEIFRVLRGPTKRERDARPVLETLKAELDAVWRLLLRKGEQRGELWYVAGLTAGGQAGVAQLLAEDHPRVVVLPIDPELLGWYAQLGGPPAIGWTGSEADVLLGELAKLPVTQVAERV